MHRFDPDRLKERSEAAFAVRRQVRFQDVDAAGLVFHPRVLEYFHDAFVDFLAAHGYPLHELIGRGPWGSPLRHAEADFLAPLRFGDEVSVAMVAAHVEPSEVTVGYRLTRLSDGKVAAVGQSVQTFVRWETFSRTPMPDDLRAAFEALGQPGGA